MCIRDRGQTNVSYTRSVAMDSGYAGFDGASNSILVTSLGTNAAPAAGPKTPGPGNRDSKRFTITWTTATPVGVRRRSVQRTSAPIAPLPTASRPFRSAVVGSFLLRTLNQSEALPQAGPLLMHH